jgi:hypothetical protein
MPMPLVVAALVLVASMAGRGSQAAYSWTFEELTARADLVAIAQHVSTEDTGRRPHPDLTPDTAVAEMRTELRVLQVLKGTGPNQLRPGATILLRHYRRLPGAGVLNGGSTLEFGAAARPYLVFLTRQADGSYEPLSGHTFSADSIFLLGRSDQLPIVPESTLPDMSGRWLLINGADAPAEAARELRVTQNDKSIAVEAIGGRLPQSRSYALGGIAGGTVAGDTRTEQSAMVRSGSLIVESARYESLGQPDERSTWRSEVWSVAGDRLTIAIEERRNDRPILDATLVYARRR